MFEVDVEEIEEIWDGKIFYDERPQRQTFEITGVGGWPIYAAGHVNDAQYESTIEDADNSKHLFNMPLKSTTLQRNQLSAVLSSEVRINAKKVMSLGESAKTTSFIEFDEGDRFKVVYHIRTVQYSDTGNDWGQYEHILVTVRIGPLPADWALPEDCEDAIEDNDPYAPLTKTNVPVEFIELLFSDDNLRKGSPLHSIALATLDNVD